MPSRICLGVSGQNTSLFDDVFDYFSLIFQCFKDVLHFFKCWVDLLQFTCIVCKVAVHGRHGTVENSKFWSFSVFRIK